MKLWSLNWHACKNMERITHYWYSEGINNFLHLLVGVALNTKSVEVVHSADTVSSPFI